MANVMETIREVLKTELLNPELPDPFPVFDAVKVLTRAAGAKPVPFYDVTKGPFKIKSLSIHSLQDLKRKIIEYCQSCFKQYPGDKCVALRKQLTGTAEYAARSTKVIKKVHLLNSYVSFRLKLLKEETWQHYHERIQSCVQVEEERNRRLQHLERLRNELTPQVLHLCHYSPQSILKACQILCDLETTIQQAKKALPNLEASPPPSAPGDSHLEVLGTKIQSTIQRGAQKFNAAITGQVEKDFIKEYTRFLDQFSERLQHEKQHLLQSIEMRMKLTIKTKDISCADLVKYISEELKKINLSHSTEEGYAQYLQNDEEWNDLLNRYVLLGGSNTELLNQCLFNLPHRDETSLSANLTAFCHPRGWVTCLTDFRRDLGVFDDSLQYLGCAPATIARFNLTLRNLQPSKEPSQNIPYADWNALFSIIDKEMSSLNELSKTAGEKDRLLIKHWRAFWDRIAITVLRKFKSHSDQMLEEVRINALITLSAEEVEFLSRLYKLAQHAYFDLEEKDSTLIKEYSSSNAPNFECARKLFFHFIKSLAARRLQNPKDTDDRRRYEKNAFSHLNLMKAFADSSVESALNTLEHVVLLKEPVPAQDVFWESILKICNKEEERISSLRYLIITLLSHIPNGHHAYFSFLQECEKRIQTQGNEGVLPIVHWKAQKIEEHNEFIRSTIRPRLFQSASTPCQLKELEAFCKDINTIPECKAEFIKEILKFFEKTYKGEEQLIYFLSHLLKGLDDEACTKEFLKKILAATNSLPFIKSSLEVLSTSCTRSADCQLLVKEWLLLKIQNEAPAAYMCEELGSIVDMGCSQHKEEIYYAIDSSILTKIKEHLAIIAATPVSTTQMGTFLDTFPRGIFPCSIRGKREYHETIAAYQPEHWNPSVWLLIRVWGPEEVAQKWRAAWLQLATSQRQHSSPQEILSYEGKEEGYFRLRALFGDHLADVINALKTYCAQPGKADPRLGEQLQTLLINQYGFPQHLTSRDESIYMSYCELTGQFSQVVKPFLEKIKQFKTFLSERKWPEALGLFQEALGRQELNLFVVLLHNLEEWLAEHFLKAQDINAIDPLMTLYKTVNDQLLLTLCPQLDTKPFQSVLQSLKCLLSICESIQPLHKFYRAFLSYSMHRPQKDWLLLLEEGMWKDCYGLLSDRMCHGIVSLLNMHLPLCTSPYSITAWEAAYRLLLRSSSCREKDLNIIENAVLFTHQQQNKFSFSEQEARWRRELNTLLPQAQGGTGYISLTVGRTNLHPKLRETLDANGQCVVKQAQDHSHPVTRIVVQDPPCDVFYKWKPRGLGIQLVTHYLYRQIWGGVSPFLDLIKIAGKEGFFQISKTIAGHCLEELLADRKQIPAIDPLSFSQNFVDFLLQCQWDGSAKNYQAQKTDSGFTLCNVDPEIAFHQPYTITITPNEVKIEIHLKSIILCFRNLDDILHPAVVARLRDMLIAKELNQVLILCKQARRRMIQCFEEKEESQNWDQQDPRYVGIPIQKRYLEHWYMTLWRLQQLVRKNPQITHWQILEIIFPPIADQIRKAHAISNHPEDRFEYLYKDKYKVVNILKDGKSRKTMLTQHSRKVLQSCLSQEPEKVVQPSFAYMDLNAAFKYLSAKNKQSKQLLEIRRQIEAGNFEPFKDVKDRAFREQILWGTDAKERITWTESHRPLLEHMKNLEWEYLYLGNCPCLTKEILLELLSHSPMLQVLDLTGCQFVDAILCTQISLKAPSLQELIISKSNIEGFNYNLSSFSEVLRKLVGARPYLIFPQLKKLEINGCIQLKDFYLEAPQLRLLTINRSLGLEYFYMLASKACRLEAAGCCLQFAHDLGFMTIQEESQNCSSWSASLQLSSQGKNGVSLVHGCVQYGLEEQLVTALPPHSLNTPRGRNFSSILNNGDDYANTPLHHAIFYGKSKIVELLVNFGANPFIVNKDRMHALHVAVFINHVKSVYYISRYRIDIENFYEIYEVLDGMTIFHLAAAMNACDSYKTLGENQLELILAKYNHHDSYLPSYISLTPALHFAVKPPIDFYRKFWISTHPQFAEIQEKIKNKKDFSECPFEQVEMVKLLIERKHDVNKTDANGQTALHIAAQYPLPNVLNALLEAKAEVNAKDLQDQTPLHFAAGKGILDNVQKLVAKGASVNAQDKRGYSPLHVACMMGHKNVFSWLLENGADRKLKSTDGSALNVAKKYEHNDIVNILQILEYLDPLLNTVR